MNLVKLITDQLSSDTLAKLSSVLGVDSETIESAVTAAVPSMLSGLGGLAAQEDGVRKLTTALGGLDDTMFGNFDRLLSGDNGGMLQKGGLLLNSLFGDGLSANLVTALSRFTGISPATAKSLLAYLTPLVLGRVASQWRNQGGTPGALKSLFADQRRHIVDALPSGFSLDDVPGLTSGHDPRAAAAHSAGAAGAPPKSLTSALLPLAIVVAAAVLLWSLLHNRPRPQEAGVKPALENSEAVVAMKPVMPDSPRVGDVSQLKQDWSDLFGRAAASIEAISDRASADAALPKLEDVDRQLESAGRDVAVLPGESRTALHAFLQEQVEKLKLEIARVRQLPGLSERVTSLLDKIDRKLDELIGRVERP